MLHRTRALHIMLAFCLICTSASCSDPAPDPDPHLTAFLDDSSGPPEPLPQDDLLRQKADVLVLPTISVTVWAIGALMVYIGAQTVYSNTVEDFEIVLGDALGNGADWSWAEANHEPSAQAAHLTDSLNRVAYRSEHSDFYSVSGNDYLRFLNMTSPRYILDPQALKDMLDGKVKPFGRYAQEYFAALQRASAQARHLTDDNQAEGLCARATVSTIAQPSFAYQGVARARGVVDIIPAVILASLKATIRCGMYDADIREFVHGYFDVSDTRGSLADIFISHSLRSAKLLFDYVDVCQLPPQIEINLDSGDCHDEAF